MWNNCRCNHPCPIFCGRVRCCTNDIVNPILTNNFGFFNNTATQTVGAFGTIAVNFVLGEGSSISQSNLVSGVISLAPGTYEVSYFANATLQANGTAGIALELNGVAISGSQVNATGTAGEVLPLSQTIMISVPQTSTLELTNNTANSQTISLASVSIKRL